MGAKNYLMIIANFMGKENKYGFTLIELLVVVAVISLLTSLVLVSIRGAAARARDATRIKNIIDIIKMIDGYYIEFGNFPGEGDTGGAHLSPKCPSDLKNDLIGADYFGQIPADPLDEKTACTNNSDGAYFYGWDSTHCCEGSYCISINTLETDWGADQLLQRFGQMNYVTGGGDANIGTGDDFNYCFVPN